MLPAEFFWTCCLRHISEGERITRILAEAINSVEPGYLVRRFIHREGDKITIADRSYDLGEFQRVVILGMGKASIGMSTTIVDILGDRLDTGLVITKNAINDHHLPFSVLEGDHPVPAQRSLEAGRRTVELVSSLGPNDLLICLISGGGSSLVTAPVEGVNLADIQALTSALLTCGARIDDINILRRRLDKVKGGGIASSANGATIISLILSDVVSNSIEAIASGPTAPDPSSRADAFTVLASYDPKKRIPISIPRSIRVSPETPKPGNPFFMKVQNVIVGNNQMAVQAALKQAKAEGFHPYLLRLDIQGEARQAAYQLSTFLRQSSLTGDPVNRPVCIVAGGETTVKIRGDGLGGRNTELALAAVSELAGIPGVLMVSLATDGEDGPTDAAGAVINGETFRRAGELGLDPSYFLERNDSYTFFEKLDDLLKPGPTGTNVNDLVFLFIL